MVTQARRDLSADTAKPRSAVEEERALARAASGIAVESGDTVGYSAGDGGSVTQLTSKATAVTLNKLCGQIITHNASLAANTTVLFEVDNTFIVGTDVVVLSLASGANSSYIVTVDGVFDTAFMVAIRNITVGPLATALTLNFAVIKGSIT